MSQNETAPCAKCDEEISVEASKCPHCENYPAKTAKWSSVALMLVGVLLMWIPIVGVPVFLIGLVARVGIRFADYSPTEHAFD